jgi:hypothetical protein
MTDYDMEVVDKINTFLLNLLWCFITAMEALTKTVGKEVNKLVPAETKGLFDEVKSFSSRVTVPLAVT